MPIVTVELLPGRSVEQKRKAARDITNAVVESLKVDASHVTVIFHEVPRENLATGGVLLADR